MSLFSTRMFGWFSMLFSSWWFRLGAALSLTMSITSQLPAGARSDESGYRQPPEPIASILDAPPPPAISVSPDRTRLLYLERRGLPTIAELAAPELGLAGVRINPRANAPSRVSTFIDYAVRPLMGGPDTPLIRPQRDPDDPPGTDHRILSAQWAPDGRRILLAILEDHGVSLRLFDLESGRERRLIGPRLNAVFSAEFDFLPDGSGFVALLVPEDRSPAPERPSTPTGPIIQQTGDKPAPGRTYQDLLKDPFDEILFEYYFTSQLVFGDFEGHLTPLGPPGLFTSVEPSPNSQYLLVELLHRPFSYLVPAGRFPTRVEVWNRRGELVKQVADLPLRETIPVSFDAVAEGPRGVTWREDAEATLVWAEALDGGDPEVPAEKRDRVRVWSAPFDGEPTTLIDLEYRRAGLLWCRGDLAIVTEDWFKTRRNRTWILAPDHPDIPPRVLFDRSSEDRYNDPGRLVATLRPDGRRLLMTSTDGRFAYLNNPSGATPEGSRPFLDRLDLQTGQTERLWRNQGDCFEQVVAILDPEATQVLISRESPLEPTNYHLLTLADGQTTRLTDFPDPAPQLAGIKPELIRYTRDDGVELNAKLYLPPGYDKSQGPLPFLLWAYPREFKSAAAASQVSGSPHVFVRPSGDSPLFLLTQGYGLLDGPAMPIIGEGDEEPNDRYIEQLVASAKAAVNKLVELGVADRDRIAIGGHSYGAFMTANLLAHSDLFRAGIARSGAYNRTLTPFGFQAEERTFWQARDVYIQMSPFTYADRIKVPLLLIHGQADNNPGTFPLQTERFYAAIKGTGGHARLVLLPAESHGYRARESVGHVLWEMIDWLDRHVKPTRSPNAATSQAREETSSSEP